MKTMMLLGGVTGFLLGLILGWVRETPWPTTLWRACLTAYVAGLLLRWWTVLWIRSWHQAYLERQGADRNEAVPHPTQGKK